MNYYEHHIGDYAEATGHLSFVEDAAYSRMIRKYYSTEKPLPIEVKDVQRLVGARSKEEKNAVVTCLQEFFILESDGWHQKRCDADIEKFLAGKPERDAKKANETARVKAHREERSKLFQTLADAGFHAPWNIAIEELRKRVTALATDKPVTPPVTGTDTQPVMPPVTAPDTPATATQTPDTRHQTPDTSIKDIGGAEEKAARASRLPKSWRPSDELMDWAQAERPDLNITQTVAQFVDFWLGKSGKDGTKLDWDATFRNWIRNQRQRLSHGIQARSFQQQNADAAAARVAEFAPGVAARSASPQLTIIEGDSHVRRIN